MPSSIARVAKELSIPKTTSPKGSSLVRISWLTRAPPSPGARVSSVRPVSASNAAISSSGRANESCVTNTTVPASAAAPGASPPEPLSPIAEQAASPVSAVSAPTAVMILTSRAMGPPRRRRGWRTPSPGRRPPGRRGFLRFPTPYAGITRIRFEGLRCPALSASCPASRGDAPLSFGATLPLSGHHRRYSRDAPPDPPPPLESIGDGGRTAVRSPRATGERRPGCGSEEDAMSVLAQLFAGTHDEALARADALDSGREPGAALHLNLRSVTALDLETLGEIAARVVRFGSGDTEPAEIDVEHELLFRLPEFWCEVFAELGSTEDPDALGKVADAWAATEEMAGNGDLRRVVRDVVGLAAEAQEAGQGVYLWV